MNDLGIDESWIKGGLDINQIENILSLIAQKRKTKEILPSQDNILSALKFTSLDNVKVLIIGQDPYPSSEHAHGLAFSSCCVILFSENKGGMNHVGSFLYASFESDGRVVGL